MQIALLYSLMTIQETQRNRCLILGGKMRAYREDIEHLADRKLNGLLLRMLIGLL